MIILILRKASIYCIIFVLYSVSVLFSFTIFAIEQPVYSEVTNIDENDETTYTLVSDGESGNTSNSTGGDYESNVSSNNSTSYTQSEKNALTVRNSIISTMQKWANQLKNSSQNSFNSGYGTNIINLTIGAVSKNDIANLLNMVNELKSFNDAAWVSTYNNLANSSLQEAADSEYGMLSTEEKRTVRKEIAKKENPNAIIRSSDNSSAIYITNAGKYRVKDIAGVGKVGITKYNDYGYVVMPSNNRTNQGNIVRGDAYSGIPSMVDTSNYSDRFNGFKNLADSERWIVSSNGEGTNKSTQYSYNKGVLGGGSSSSLCDDVSIALLTDYHIYRVKKDYVTNINYTSNKRRWLIYLNGEKIGEPVITDNPQHELNFTEIYKEYGAGEYLVVAEQKAYVTKATYVQYDICNYLFETDTGNILYYTESLVTGQGGGSILINESTNNTPKWHKTGDTFTVRVNNLGQYDVDGTDTQREK